MGIVKPSSIKVAFIGAGRMIQAHLAVFSTINEVELTGIYSRTWEKSKNCAHSFGIKIVAESIEELYSSTQADLVVVAASISAMDHIALECIGYPWKILLEKPFGYNYHTSKNVYEEVQKLNRQNDIYVALNRRFLNATLNVEKDLAKQNSNLKRFVRVSDCQNIDEALSYGHSRAIAENFMYSNSIHLLDYFSIFCRGELLSVTPVVPWSANFPGIVLTHLSFSSGDIGLYEAIWNGPGPWGIMITTPSIRWEMRPLEQAAYQKNNQRIMTNITFEDDDDICFKPGLKKQALAAIAMVKNQKHSLPSITSAYQTVSLISKIYC